MDRTAGLLGQNFDSGIEIDQRDLQRFGVRAARCALRLRQRPEALKDRFELFTDLASEDLMHFDKKVL